jgi:hypothetical protein
MNGPPGSQPYDDVLAGPRPGEAVLLGAGLALGVLLLAVQLWLLTIALELYLSGHGERGWSLALVSGVVFVGGLLMLWLLRRRPAVRRRSARAGSVEGSR